MTGALERPPYVVLTQMHDGDVLVHGEGPLMTDAERWAKYGLAQMVGPDSDPTPHVIAPSHRQFLVRLRAALGKWHPHLDYELRLL